MFDDLDLRIEFLATLFRGILNWTNSSLFLKQSK